MFVLTQRDSYGGRFGCFVSLHERLKTAEERTRFVGEVIKSLVEEDEQLIPGIRNEVYYSW